MRELDLARPEYLQPPVAAATHALTHGLADADDPRLAEDIAATIASLQANPNSGRESALSR